MFPTSYFGANHYGTEYWPPIDGDTKLPPGFPTVGDDYPWNVSRETLLPYFGPNVTEMLRAEAVKDLRAKQKRAVRAVKKAEKTGKTKDIEEAFKKQAVFEGTVQKYAPIEYRPVRLPQRQSLAIHTAMLAVWEARLGNDVQVPEYQFPEIDAVLDELDRILRKRREEEALITLLL